MAGDPDLLRGPPYSWRGRTLKAHAQAQEMSNKISDRDDTKRGPDTLALRGLTPLPEEGRVITLPAVR